MDAFFAAVEERENPHFKGKPIVVGADPAPEQVRYGAGPKGEIIMRATGRGVVATCNYEARKYGIHSAMPISKAYRLCPNAIFLPVNMELYQKVSENIMEIVKKYSPIFEQVSLDEAYLNLSLVFHDRRKQGIEWAWEEAKEIARKLKAEILEKEKLTSTVGIGPNKLIAKMASEKGKPDGLLTIKPNQVRKFLEPLDIEDLPGIGPKTAEKLRPLGINKIEELKKLPRTELKNMFGVVGETIYERARGVDERPFISTLRFARVIDEEPVTSEEIIKSISESANWRTKGEKRFISSIGKEYTFEKDTRDPEIIFETFEKLIKEVHDELKENNFSFKTITVICRFSDFETHTKSKTEPRPLKMGGAKVKMRMKSSLPTLKEPINNFEILKKEAKKLLLKFLIESPKLIRLIGLRIHVC